jgi:hypothetical protein
MDSESQRNRHCLGALRLALQEEVLILAESPRIPQKCYQPLALSLLKALDRIAQYAGYLSLRESGDPGGPV